MSNSGHRRLLLGVASGPRQYELQSHLRVYAFEDIDVVPSLLGARTEPLSPNAALSRSCALGSPPWRTVREGAIPWCDEGAEIALSRPS